MVDIVFMVMLLYKTSLLRWISFWYRPDVGCQLFRFLNRLAFQTTMGTSSWQIVKNELRTNTNFNTLNHIKDDESEFSVEIVQVNDRLEIIPSLNVWLTLSTAMANNQPDDNSWHKKRNVQQMACHQPSFLRLSIIGFDRLYLCGFTMR